MDRARLETRAPWILGGVALLYRVVLTRIYWGHEEEDWANLLLFHGVLDSHFAQVELEHMPLYSWVAALATAALGDAEAGGEFVAVVLGAASVGILVAIGIRWLSLEAGLLAGVLAVFQPEWALYAASPLRESTYTALALGGIAAIGSHRMRLGAALLALSFLTRFNTAFTLLPALVLWMIVRHRGRGPTAPPWEPGRWRSLLLPTLAVAGVVVVWAIFYWMEEGTVVFWGGVVGRNTTPVQDLFFTERILAVARAVGGVFGLVVPIHVGWLVVPMAIPGILWAMRGRHRQADGSEWLALCALCTWGFLALTAAASTYEWQHNLYWKWICPSVPFLLLFSAHGVVETVRRRETSKGAQTLAAVYLVASLCGYGAVTLGQVDRSEQWYGTQVRLARWAVDAFPKDAGVVAEGIPYWVLGSEKHALRILPWSAVEIPRDDPDALAAWAADRGIGLLFWYREEWTDSNDVAPYLRRGESFEGADGTVLLPIAREDGYGLIVYQVVAKVGPQPSHLPDSVRGLLRTPTEAGN